MRLKSVGVVRLGLSLACGLIFTSLHAGVVVWTNGAGDGDWANGANWADEAAPAATDTAFFAATVTVTPPESFTGTLAVSNATVTVQVEADTARSFSSAVHAGAKLIKTGTGTLTLKAAPGPYSGDISVGAGEVRFSGNGATAASGLFGHLSVASGATARVVDSPADTRHGALVVAVDNNKVEFEEASFQATVNTFADYLEIWDGIEVTNENQRAVYLPTKDRPLFAASNLWMPTFYQWRDYFALYSRAVFLSSVAGTASFQHRADDFTVLYIDGAKFLTGNNNTQAKSRTLTAGWHSIDTAMAENAGNEYLEMFFSGPMFNAATRFEADLLWRGVCFSGLNLPDGATLDVAAGQAVAFALGAEMDVAGTVSGGAGSVVTVASGTFSAAAASLGDFAGSVEVTKFATVDLSNVPTEPAFRVTGSGLATFGTVSALGADFVGGVEIPAGVICTNTFATGVSFTGTGTLVTSTLAGTEAFEGTIVLLGNEVRADVLTEIPLPKQTWTLSDATSLNLGNAALVIGTQEALSNFSEGCWTLNGSSIGDSASHYNQHKAYVTNDTVLVLTDDGGAQRNSSILTNRTFTIEDACDISFVYRNEMLKKYSRENRAEGASFFFTTQPNGVGGSGLAFPTDAYGFTLYQYRDSGTQGFSWVVGGTRSDTDYTEAQMGLDMREPMEVLLRLRQGVFSVELKQNGKVFRASRDFSEGFGADVRRFFGFSGGTGDWGPPETASSVYCYQTISNFVGTVNGQGSHKVVDGYLPVSTETWRLKETGVAITNDTELLFAWKATEGTATSCDGFAVCRKTLPVRQAFTLTFNERLDKSVSGWAEGLSVFLTPDADAVTCTGTTSGRFYPRNAREVAFIHYYWENQFCWNHNGSLYSDDWSEKNPGGIPKSTGTNKIRLDYDGAGTFKATVRRGTAVWTSTRTYPDVLAWGDEMYLGFMGGTSTWGAYLQTRVTDLDLGFSDNPEKLVPALNVEAGASAALTLGNLEPATSEPSLTITTSTLGAGSTLTVTSETTKGARLALGEVSLSGPATLAANAGAIIELADVQSAGPLTVTGAWDGRPVFHIDVARIGSGLVLAHLDPEQFAGDGEPVFTVLDQNGDELNKYTISYKGGVLKILPAGVVIYIR